MPILGQLLAAALPVAIGALEEEAGAFEPFGRDLWPLRLMAALLLVTGALVAFFARPRGADTSSAATGATQLDQSEREMATTGIVTRTDRLLGAITFFVMLAIAFSWVIQGFFRVSIAWQLGLGIPLLYVLVGNATLMLGKSMPTWRTILRSVRGRKEIGTQRRENS